MIIILKRVVRITASDSRNDEYNQYLEEHISNVIRAWDEQLKPSIENDYLEQDIKEAELSILEHDSSKYQSDEYYAYLNHFYPSDKYPDDEDAYGMAWLLHQHRNPHHWQYWVLPNDDGSIRSLDIPFSEVCNMLCDWHSFSAKDPSSTAQKWYADNGSKMQLSDETKRLIDELIIYLGEPL